MSREHGLTEAERLEAAGPRVGLHEIMALMLATKQLVADCEARHPEAPGWAQIEAAGEALAAIAPQVLGACAQAWLAGAGGQEGPAGDRAS